MKRSVFVLLAAVLLLSASSVVYASGPEPIDVSGDCEGWELYGIMNFGTWDYMDYDFTVELYQDGVLVYEYYGEGTLYLADGWNFNFAGRWGMELCGEYKVAIKFWWYGEYGKGGKYLEDQFMCECGLPAACTFTPGYWKNHPEDWPVTHLTVGCEEYTQRELIRIFDMPTRGDMTIKMFHHLVAAKLNVLLPDADDSIMRAINAGDDYLCTYGLFSKPKDPLKTEAENIKDALAAYNEIPCEGEEEEEFEAMLSIEGPAAVDNAATEESSWGSIKKRHE